MEINTIVVAKNNIKCITGYIAKGEPAFVIRNKNEKIVDIINFRNQLIYNVPINCLYYEKE